MFLAAILNVEVLDARVQQLQLGELALEVRPATMPAFDFALTLWNVRRAALTLDEGQSLAVRITHALLSQRGYVVGEQVHGLDNCLWIIVGSLRHVIRQVYLELEVSAIVGSTELHAREVAFAAYFFGFNDSSPICRVNVFRPYSLSNELRCHKSWFSTKRTSVRLDHANQGLRLFHILCGLLESVGALLMVVKAAAVPSDD